MKACAKSGKTINEDPRLLDRQEYFECIAVGQASAGGDVSIAGPILICAEGENLDNGYMTPNLALNVDLLQNGHETTL